MIENRVRSPHNHFSFAKTAVGSPRSSILQNISNLASTSSTNFQRSTISTSKSKNQNRNGSIEKSKIKTLPNYEKYLMGNNLPFVVIFQTVQIERLSDEIQTQRIKLKQYQRLVFNNASFQVQIKELSQRCTIYEGQLNQYRQQLDKMNKICQTLYHENQNLKNKLKSTDYTLRLKLEEQTNRSIQLLQDLQRWKNKYELSQQNKQNQLEQIKFMMEKQRKSMIDRQMKDLQIKHSSQIAKLNIQVRRLNQLLDIKQRDLEDYKKKYQNSQDYIRQLRDYGLKIGEYEQKICLLSQQKFRLSQIIDVNATQLDNARRKQFKLNQKLITDRQLMLDNQHLKQIIQMKQKQLQSWKSKILQLEDQVLKGREQKQRNSQLLTRIQCMMSQNQKISKLLKDRSSQIEKWKKVVQDLQQDNSRSREVQGLLIQLQSKNKVLQAQNQRLQGINSIRLREIEQSKNRLLVSQEQLLNLTRIQKQKKNIQQKYKSQVQRILQLQLYIQTLQQQTSNIKNSDHKLKSTQPIIQSLKKQNQRLYLRIGEYQKQLSALKQFESEVGKQSTKLRDTDNIVLQYEEKIEVINEEVERLGQLIKAKNQQIVRLEDQRIGNFSVISQCKGLQNQIQENQRTIAKMKAEIDGYKAKIFNYEQNMQNIDTKNKQLFNGLNQQIQKSQEQLKKKTRQCDQLKIKQSTMLSQIKQIGQIQKLNQKQQNRITIYLKDLQDLRMQNKQQQAVISQQKKKNQQLQTKLKKSPQAPQSCQSSISCSSSSASSSQHRKSCQSNKTVISSLNAAIIDPQKLLNKINSLQNTLIDLKTKYGELLGVVEATGGSVKGSMRGLGEVL